MTGTASDVKRLGILTSGGDCAGLNAVIRAVVCRARYGPWLARLRHSRQGTMGLLRRPLEYEELDVGVVTGNVLRMGGTILGTTNKGNRLRFPMPTDAARPLGGADRRLSQLALDALIGTGRRRQLRHPAAACPAGGFNLVGIPRPSTKTTSAPPRTRWATSRPWRSPRGARPAAADRGEPRPGDDTSR